MVARSRASSQTSNWTRTSRPRPPISRDVYSEAQSKSPSPSAINPIQVRQDSYTLQRLVSVTRKRFSGWKMGMLLAISANLAVLISILALTLFTTFGFSRTGFQVTLIEDNCNSVRNWSTWLHLGINIVSTVLLSRSSYVMQCLTSHTRREINKAHIYGRYMDIGVPSFQNLLYVTRYRVSLWLLLVLSSLPLHLLTNSAM